MKILFNPFLGILLIVFIAAGTLRGQDSLVVREISRHREEKNGEFLNPKESPLEKKDLRKFSGLKYYPVDLAYRVRARFIRNETPVLFQMPTTTSRLPEYVRFGDVVFSLDGKEYRLGVYQSPEIITRPGYEDYLFIPFTDDTNGEETYDIGRYLDFRIPQGSEVTLDFNMAYNPYCSYSNRFSCPIPPVSNNLPVAIRAGEKRYRHSGH